MKLWKRIKQFDKDHNLLVLGLGFIIIGIAWGWIASYGHPFEMGIMTAFSWIFWYKFYCHPDKPI